MLTSTLSFITKTICYVMHNAQCSNCRALLLASQSPCSGLQRPVSKKTSKKQFRRKILGVLTMYTNYLQVLHHLVIATPRNYLSSSTGKANMAIKVQNPKYWPINFDVLYTSTN